MARGSGMETRQLVVVAALTEDRRKGSITNETGGADAEGPC